VAEMLSGKSVLVTGADGFIGSHLVERLVGLGAKVRAFVLYNSWNSIGWLEDTTAKARANTELIAGDIRDPGRVAEACRDCEYVFHLSSLIAIPYSYVAPRSYVETNVLGALNVLDACRRSDRLRRLVHVSTSEVYGTAQRVPIDEDHPLVGQSPYSATKIGADVLATSYHRSFGMPVVIARPFNTFGPRQTARAVIPTIATQLLAGCTALQLGSTTPTRDFNYVTDTANGMIALATCAEAEGQTVNIGTGVEHSIEQTARMLMQIIGHTVPITADEVRLRPQASEVERLCADNRLITRLTDWAPKVTFGEGLMHTVEWIKKNPHRFPSTGYAV
jgi:NAD dependent epimerase/dehydratase